ncbi:2248_t:CDS:2, partial [Racocetra persica]
LQYLYNVEIEVDWFGVMFLAEGIADCLDLINILRGTMQDFKTLSATIKEFVKTKISLPSSSTTSSPANLSPSEEFIEIVTTTLAKN